MEHWMCTECNYAFEAEMPPETCPSCKAKCEFVNVTCYIPECGGPGNIDIRLVAQRVQEAKEKGSS